MTDENERLAFVIGQWLETTRTLIRLKLSEGVLLAALQEIVAYQVGELIQPDIIRTLKDKASNAIARQKGGAE